MIKAKTDYMVTSLGIILLAAGLYLVKTLPDPQGLLLALPYIFIGFGCGIFGHGMGNIISRKLTKNAPDIQKKLEIEKNDERNIAISNRAKAKAFDMMTFVFGALMVSFALMRIDMTAVLLLVFVYLFVHGYGIYFRMKYDKEM
ncbi:hypothetical protein LAD12857_01600 [Lacrimispora amygdalina]|uniref:DUF2178 domain-containing protein n=1 Tax=Lacrimispora amygdalina TaxID=253257 RepID=A0ABQ5M005_9FIRM